jgi:hypothetical protein
MLSSIEQYGKEKEMPCNLEEKFLDIWTYLYKM